MNKIVQFSDIFEIETHKNIDVNKTKPGDINLIGLSGFNNGLRTKISKIDELIIAGNCITIPLDGEYMGTAFYQRDRFITTQNVHVLRLKKGILTEEVALYLVTILKKIKSLFFYGRKLTRSRLVEQLIELPFKNDELDIKFMTKQIELSIQSAKKNIFKPKTRKLSIDKIDFSEWKLFHLPDLFYISGTKTTKKNPISKSQFLYITTKSKDNGMENFNKSFTEDGHVITIDSATDGVAFYQPNKFSASDHVEKLTPKDDIPKFAMLFITVVLNKYVKEFYHYGLKRAKMRIKEEKILLPATKEGKPDYIWMNEYMKKFIEFK